MRILRFVGLKIAEICGMLLSLHLLSIFHKWIAPIIHDPRTVETFVNHYWMVQGFYGLIILTMIITIPVLVGCLLYLWIKTNWEMSESDFLLTIK